MFTRIQRKGRVILFATLVMMAYTFLLALDLRNGCKHINGSVNAFVYPLMLNDPYYILLLSISLIYLFTGNVELSLTKSEFRYTIFIRNAIFVGILLSVFSCLISIVVVMPYVAFSSEWETTIEALSTYARGNMRYWRISYDIISTTPPLLALGEAICLIATYALFMSILVEHSRKSHLILVITVMMCFSDFQVNNELPTWCGYFFPPSILRIALTSPKTFIYAIGCLFIRTVLLLMILVKRREKV